MHLYPSSSMTDQLLSSPFLFLDPTSVLRGHKEAIYNINTLTRLRGKEQTETFLTAVVVLSGRQLFSELLHVIWMKLVIQRGSEPIGLCLIQNRCDRVRYINNVAGLTRHDKQKTISSLQNKMLQLLQKERES